MSVYLFSLYAVAKDSNDALQCFQREKKKRRTNCFSHRKYRIIRNILGEEKNKTLKTMRRKHLQKDVL